MRLADSLIVLAVLDLAGPQPAQDLLWRVEGTSGLVGRGADLHRMGDYNQDGWEDLLELGELWNGQGRIRAMRIVSGRDGSILSSGLPVSILWVIGNTAPLGDMNGDGVLDYGAHIYDPGNVANTQTLAVFSGSTHLPIWTATIPNGGGTGFGAVLCGELDVNGDGRNDVVTSAYYLSPLGTIIVYDNSGIELYRIVDPVPNVRVGLDVATLRGDLDGDGCPDFVSTGVESQNRGAVVCFSGRTGAVLRVSLGEQPGDQLVNAGACGDIDGDGVPDYCGGGSFGASVVTAFSGATGQIIHSWRDTQACCMGISVTGGYDLDQDGVPDLAAGSYGTYMNVFSGRDGTFLWRFLDSLYPSASCSGEALAMIAPPPGEQYPVFVYTERCWHTFTQTNPCAVNAICPGAVYAYRGCPRGVRAYGAPDASPNQPLAKSGMRSPTASATPMVRFTMSEAPAGAAAVLMLGTSDVAIRSVALPLQLDPYGLPGITLWTSSDVTLFTIAGSAGMGRGYASFDLRLPPGRIIDSSGTPLYAQWLWFDASNIQSHGSTAGQRFRLR